jgi:anti-sigma factor RsiW
VSCKRARSELLDYFAFGEELGSRSDPYLAHVQTCEECRTEIGIDQALVKSLRRALRERVEGRVPSAASWQLVRLRTVDRQERPWASRLVQWGGMASAATAAVLLLFAVVTAPDSRILPSTSSLVITATSRRAIAPVDEGLGLPALQDTQDPGARQPTPPFPGWPNNTQKQASTTSSSHQIEPPISSRMREFRAES